MAEEKRFENRIKKYLRSEGIYPAGSGYHLDDIHGWYIKIWGGGYQKSGIPDMIICIEGLFVAVELKATHGRLSELQKINIKQITDGGGWAFSLYPNQFDEFKQFVKGVKECGSRTRELTASINAPENIGINT